MKLLNQLKQELGMSIILVTHDLGVIAQMCDRVAVMYAGQIVEMTDTVTLFSRPRHPYTYGLMGSLPNEETAGTTLEAIKGSPPNLAHLPEGCPSPHGANTPATSAAGSGPRSPRWSRATWPAVTAWT